MSKPFKTICAIFFLMASQLAGAEAITSTKEGDKVSGHVTFSERTLFSNKKKADIPLPPGEWTVRLVEKVKSNHSDSVSGVMLAMDKIENNLVTESINISAYDQNQRLWNVTCEPGISHQPNLGNYDSECFTLDLKTFMSDSASDWQNKLRKKWNDAGISWGGNALSASLYIISPTFGHVAVYYSIPTGRFLDDSKTARESPLHSSKLNNADEKIKSLLPVIREWYQDYFKRVKEGVYKAKDNLPPSRLSAGIRSVVADIEKLAAKATGATNAIAVAEASPKPKISTPANLSDLSIDDDLSLPVDWEQRASTAADDIKKGLEQLRIMKAEQDKLTRLAEEAAQKEKQRVIEAERRKAAEVKASQDAATKQSQHPSSSFIFVSKLTPDEIRSKFFDSDEWKIRINHFLLNYRFIEYFPSLLNSTSFGADILKKEFQPYLPDMVKAKDGMDNVLKNYAKSLNVPPEIIYRTFGIVFDNDGRLIESYGGSLATGRKMAIDYFYRRPINDFFDTRDPRALFTGWYPQLISSFNSDGPKILALAVTTEAKLKKEKFDAEQAAEKGQLERDRQRVLDEQKTYGQKLNLPPPLDLAKDQTELKAACVSATWEYSSRVGNNSLGPSQWANCVSLGMYGDPKFIPYMNAWRATFRNGTFDIGSLGAYHDRCFRDFIVTVDSSGRCMSVFDATPTSRTNVK